MVIGGGSVNLFVILRFNPNTQYGKVVINGSNGNKQSQISKSLRATITTTMNLYFSRDKDLNYNK